MVFPLFLINDNIENMSDKSSIKNILKKTILISGAVARSIIGIGATVLLFFALKKKKGKQL
jgi:hypothetical protein